MVLVWTFGQLDAFLLNSLKRSQYFVEIHKLIQSSKSSNYSALPRQLNGPTSSTYLTLNQLSQNLRGLTLRLTSKTLTKQVWIYA